VMIVDRVDRIVEQTHVSRTHLEMERVDTGFVELRIDLRVTNDKRHEQPDGRASRVALDRPTNVARWRHVSPSSGLMIRTHAL
jgi:hypothetical protein